MDSCCPEMIALPYVSQIYSYSRTASGEALGLERTGLTVGSDSSGAAVVLLDELPDDEELLEAIVEVVVVELGTVETVAVDELSTALSEVLPELSIVLSTVLSTEVLSGAADELSVLSLLSSLLVEDVVDDNELLLNDELELLELDVELDGLSALLELDGMSELLELDELSTAELSALSAQAVSDSTIPSAVIIDRKRFIFTLPFGLFTLIIHYYPGKCNIYSKILTAAIEKNRSQATKRSTVC